MVASLAVLAAVVLRRNAGPGPPLVPAHAWTMASALTRSAGVLAVVTPVPSPVAEATATATTAWEGAPALLSRAPLEESCRAFPIVHNFIKIGKPVLPIMPVALYRRLQPHILWL